MFDNSTMRQPVRGKPHIVKIKGYWRVSPLRTHNPTMRQNARWHYAHVFASRLNWNKDQL